MPHPIPGDMALASIILVLAALAALALWSKIWFGSC